MKFKVKYRDDEDRPHVRYYNALNAATAKEMWMETFEHSTRGDNVTLKQFPSVEIFQAEESRWKRVNS